MLSSTWVEVCQALPEPGSRAELGRAQTLTEQAGVTTPRNRTAKGSPGLSCSTGGYTTILRGCQLESQRLSSPCSSLLMHPGGDGPWQYCAPSSSKAPKHHPQSPTSPQGMGDTWVNLRWGHVTAYLRSPIFTFSLGNNKLSLNRVIFCCSTA